MLPKVALSAWECTDHAECTERARGKCMAFCTGFCRYSGKPSAEGCWEDSNCIDGKGGRCDFSDCSPPRCFYDLCDSDSDCDSGSHCACPDTDEQNLTSDPWCIANGCDQDDDCEASQICRTDESITGLGPVQACSTSEDECQSNADCKDPLYGCGYEAEVGHWICRGIVSSTEVASPPLLYVRYDPSHVRESASGNGMAICGGKATAAVAAPRKSSKR
jgi:hypothetical protein